MKIIHFIAGNLDGGAAKGAFVLHEELCKIGIDSKVITNSSILYGDKTISIYKKNDGDISIFEKLIKKIKTLKTIIRNKIYNKIISSYKKRKKLIFSTGLTGSDFTYLKEFKDADIVHLHWINGLIDIRDLNKINKPIVWTIRDMWPLTGGCHYPINCNNYITGCGKCEILGSNTLNDFSRYIFNKKIKYIPANTHIIGISDWLTSEAKRSKLFKDSNIQTIHNSINIKEFKPVSKSTARYILNLETEKKIILAGAQTLTDFYKGFDLFLEATKYLNPNDYFICFFGNLSSEVLKDFNFEYKHFGFIKQPAMLSLIYSASDVFVAPSIMEAFGKTIAESMACKTPVVCFDATGPKDIVTHKKDGFKAKPYEPKGLAEGIEWITNNPEYEKICDNARYKVTTKFNIKTLVGKYVNLYKSILNE